MFFRIVLLNKKLAPATVDCGICPRRFPATEKLRARATHVILVHSLGKPTCSSSHVRAGWRRTAQQGKQLFAHAFRFQIG
jgi:hypothetical protein